jgi:hypothetical protein
MTAALMLARQRLRSNPLQKKVFWLSQRGLSVTRYGRYSSDENGGVYR